MYTISVCLRMDRRLEVARYRYASAQLAIQGRIGVMEDWKRKGKYGVLISAVQPPK